MALYWMTGIVCCVGTYLSVLHTDPYVDLHRAMSTYYNIVVCPRLSQTESCRKSAVDLADIILRTVRGILVGITLATDGITTYVGYAEPTAKPLESW